MSRVVEELSMQLFAQQQRDSVDEFDAHLEERVARAKVHVAARKRPRGQPLPRHMVPGALHVEPSPETPTGTKVCKGCRRERPLVLFPPLQRFGEKASRSSLCQACIKTKEKKPKKPREITTFSDTSVVAKPLPTLEQRALRMWNSARLRAWRLSVPFVMRKKWIEDRLRAGRCEVTGLPFGEYGRRDVWTASIDREVPAKGYAESNCRMVVWLYNAAKGSGTDKDVLLMARALLDAEEAKRLAAARAEAEAGTTREKDAA